MLWDQPAWDEWRDGNFVRWLQQWEATAARYGCTAQRGWLLAEDLVPGKKRKKLSETVTDFFCLDELPTAAADVLPDSQSQA